MDDSPSEGEEDVCPDCDTGQEASFCLGNEDLTQHMHESNFLGWSSDNSLLIYSSSDDIVVFSTVRRSTEIIHESKSFDGHPDPGVFASFRPESRDIVYSTCYRESDPKAPFIWDYEIAIAESSIDQNSRLSYDWESQLLTDNNDIDHYPIWSPDGNSIAFLSSRYTLEGVQDHAVQLYVMDSGGGNRRRLTTLGLGVTLLPPVWSDGGETILFYANERMIDASGNYLPIEPVLYGVDPDGTDLRRIGGTHKTWVGSLQDMVVISPSGLLVARVSADSLKPIVYVENTKGGEQERREVVVKEPQDAGKDRVVRRVLWSPDEKELLVVVGDVEPTGLSTPSVYVVAVEGGATRTLVERGEREGDYTAAWSPDSSRVAVRADHPWWFYGPRHLFMVDRDGTELATVVDQRR